jgi:hypothetical protein
MKLFVLTLLTSLSAHAMKFVEIDKVLETSVNISSAYTSPAVNVASVGGDSVAFMITATGASTPGGSSAYLYGSLDGTNYVLAASGISVPANGSYALTLVEPPMKWYRVTYTIASGFYTSALRVLVKGDKE